MRQKTLRVFEVDNIENLVNIIDKKYDLIKNHYFLLKEKNEQIETLLKEKNLNYFVVNGDSSPFNKEKKEQIRVVEKEIIIKEKNRVKIYDKIIRSGEEIINDYDLIFLNRINAGAKIISSGNIQLLDECEGSVICNGEYIIIKKNKGTIIFNGADIGKIDKLTFFSKEFTKVLE